MLPETRRFGAGTTLETFFRTAFADCMVVESKYLGYAVAEKKIAKQASLRPLFGVLLRVADLLLDGMLLPLAAGNVLKPVPQPPLEPELDLNKASGTKLFWGRPCHVDAQHGPKQEAGVQGGGTAPLVGSGAKPQKPAMICTYYKQTNKQKFKVRQPQRAAKSKRPNAPSDGSKNNGIHTTKQEEYPSRHPTTDTANSSTSKQITSRRLIGVSKSNTIQSTNQAGCIHMSSKSTAYVPPKTSSTPTKANTQACSYLDFNQFLIRRITRNICLRLRIKHIQILTCREQDIW